MSHRRLAWGAPIPSDERMGRPVADDGEHRPEHAEGMRTIDHAPPPQSAYHRTSHGESAPSVSRRVPRWLIALVIAGALLTAAGAVMALLPSAEHLNAAGHHYADYFVTRNFALSLVLLVTLGGRAWRVLPALMTLTALIQSFDAVTAVATGQFGLVPIDLVFAGLFLLGAARLSGHAIWPARKHAAEEGSR
jgi:hypothetical protein